MGDNDLWEYEEHRKEMQTGDILQWASRSALGWIIRKFSGATVNHTSLVVTISDYDTDRIFTTEALEFGVQLTVMSRRLVNFQGSVWWLPLMDKYDQYRPMIGRAALWTIGTRYDYRSLIRQMFGRVSANARDQFCSEHAFLSTKRGGVPELRGITVAPRPGDMPSLGIYVEEIQIL